jgi:thymidylate synthase (methanogen type)
MEIIGKNVVDAWKKTLELIMNQGKDFIDKDKRVCREILNFLLVIESLNDIEEPVDMMKSFKDFVYPSKEEFKNIMLDKINASGYTYSYGHRLFNYRNVKNQIDNFIYKILKSNPNSRRAIALVYDPLIDSLKNKKYTPGLISIYFRITNSKLEMNAVIRSNDFFIGWPANIYQLFMLQNYLADKLKIPTGKISVFSNSAHIFQEHFEKINKII